MIAIGAGGLTVWRGFMTRPPNAPGVRARTHDRFHLRRLREEFGLVGVAVLMLVYAF